MNQAEEKNWFIQKIRIYYVYEEKYGIARSNC